MAGVLSISDKLMSMVDVVAKSDKDKPVVGAKSGRVGPESSLLEKYNIHKR